MATKSRSNVDLFNPTTWVTGTITYRRGERMVWWFPDARKKICMDQLDRSWYYFNLKQGVWYNTPRLTKLIRQLKHMIKWHEGELVTIDSVQRMCRDAQVQMLALDVNMAGGFYGHTVLTKLRHALNILGKVKDDDKVLAQARMHKIVFFRYRDQSGRVNIGAALATNIGAINALRRRVKNVRTMDAWIGFYGALAERLFVELENRVKQGIRALHHLTLGSIGPHDIMPSTETERQVPGEISLYAELITPLQYFRPFRRSAVRLVKEASQMPGLFREGHLGALVQLTQIGLVALKLLDLRCTLERAKNSVKGFGKLANGYKAKIIHALQQHVATLAPLADDHFQKPVLNVVRPQLAHLISALETQNLSEALEALDTCLSCI